MPAKYEVEPTDSVAQELERSPVRFEDLVKEAVGYLEDADSSVDDQAIARMYIQRGFSEELAYWLVREAEVRHAPS